MKACSLVNCERRHIAQGLCALHYQRARLRGELTPVPRKLICSVRGCGAKHRARGLCAMHTKRLLVTGSLLDPSPWDLRKGPTREERFWEKVDTSPGQGPNGDCWEWRGARNPHGYGMFATGKGKAVLAHRYAYQLAQGEIPKGAVVRHLVCDNPSCCNSLHLEAGSQKQNLEDMAANGRAWWQKHA